ncbi:Vegetative incompatibility protein HET-E-1 [Neonectria ditissima]|uniref:Vegetative incompatibility protein HET-E-1 n=1 Tax=Neonectria ditissima TaxID=78410 RepID=A0A0P7BR27_9HYPO|nr:Vegetative incompatibility protein HET-E-1 [Neonectria ditissima]
MAPHMFKSLRSKFKSSHASEASEPEPTPPAKPTDRAPEKAPQPIPSQPLPSEPEPPGPTTSQSVASQSVSSQPIPSQLESPDPEVSTQSLQERLWNQAYDGLKASESDMVETYEKILSRQLHGGDSTSLASQKNEIEEGQEGRSHQMKELVRIGLEKTAKNANIKQGIENGMQTATIVRGMVDKAIQASPEAAVAWVGVCLALDILSNPITEAGINRRGVSYVLSRMDWYWNLAGLLLSENRAATATSGLRGELEKHIIQLYQKLLLYQMKSICIYNRNQAIVFMRDLIKLDDWNGQLTDIQDAEAAVQKDSQQFNTEQIKSHLQTIAESAVSQEMRLQDIHSAVLAQTLQQTKFQEQQTKFQEQQAKIRLDDKYNECLGDLRDTDPRDTKTLIQDAKGGLLKDSYSWILNHADFKKWRDEPESRLLWIKGDPGKGKTMLLCGIIDEIENDETRALSYFFCQATEPKLRTATAVLRGLVYVLIDQLPSLISYVPKKYGHVGKQMFEDEAAWGTLSKMLTVMLEDPSLDGAVLIVDALDECVTELPQLLDFICQTSSSSGAKWILSSRNWPNIEEKLGAVDGIQLSLELNEHSVSSAVGAFIRYKVDRLSQAKKYDEKIRTAVLDYLTSNSDDTFLWAALVCRQLEDPKVRKWHTMAKLVTYPPGLEALYLRMMEQIYESLDADVCKEILATVATTYRPITLKELTSLVEALQDFEDEEETLREFIGFCGSFVNIRDNSIYFIHQSAKDFLLKQGSDQIMPDGLQHQHHVIFERSLDVLSRNLHRDMYSLEAVGTLIGQVSTPRPDPLGSSGYSCLYWVDHLHDSSSADSISSGEDLQDDAIAHTFLQEKYLYWLEALSLLHSISEGMKAMRRLDATVVTTETRQLTKLVRDAYRFILFHKGTIESAPLQAYISALVFSPSNSLIRGLFGNEAPQWITSPPKMEQDWDACLQTLDGHSGSVNSVDYSPEHQRLASGSNDGKVKIWDAATGTCLHTLEGHDRTVIKVAFCPSKDVQRLASGAYDSKVKIWDTDKGICVQTLQGHTSFVNVVAFAKDGKRVASGAEDEVVKIWDSVTGACLHTLAGHQRGINSVAFCLNDRQLASGSGDKTIKIWDTTTGTCLRTLEGHGETVRSVAFSLIQGVQRLVSGSGDRTIKIWDSDTGACLQTLEGHKNWVTSVVSSTIGGKQYLASASKDMTIRIWDPATGTCLHTLTSRSASIDSVVFLGDAWQLASGAGDGRIKIWDGTATGSLGTWENHSLEVTAVTCSSDGSQLASASRDKTVKIWQMATGACRHTLEGHTSAITSIILSRDNQKLASSSVDATVKIWDMATGTCLQTLEGHKKTTKAVAFNNDAQRLASGSADRTVKIWDTATGACLQTFEGHESPLKSVVFSEDSQRVASGSDDTTVKIWDANTGSCLQTLVGHDFGVVSIAFSRDNQHLASSAADETIKIWDLGTGACLQTINTDSLVSHIVFDPAADLRLCTDLGTLDLDLPSSSDSQTVDNVLEDPEYRGYGLSTDKKWITSDGKNVLWLPSEYRPLKSTLIGLTMAFGYRTGRVLGMQFSATGPTKG